MRLAQILIFGLILVFIGHCAYYYPLLPEIMASHFDGSGNPNSWMSKQLFFVFEVCLLALLVFISLLMTKIIEKTPGKWINLPNKDYWLSNERRVNSLAVIGGYWEWFGVGLMVLFISVNQLVFDANIAKKPLSSGPMWTVLIAFFIFVAVWLVLFNRKFRIPE